MFPRSPMRRGFTLIELLMSVAITSVLTAGLASSLYIATQSLDVADDDLHQTREAHRALAALHRDAQSAKAFSELTATSVTMSVPDRNGDNVPETIRYAWSGTAGDPLTYQYNGGTVETVAADVQAFNLGYLSRFIEGVVHVPRILFVSGQYADGDGGVDTPTAAEQLRIDLFESWGYDVETISQEATQATFDTELASANVVFVSGQVNSGTLGSKVTASTAGVVTESAYNAVNLGLLGSTLYVSYEYTSFIDITDASHYITQQHTAGTLQVLDTAQNLKMFFGTTDLAPATNVLAQIEMFTGGPVPLETLPVLGFSFPTLLTVDANEELFGGGDAAGRRVLLPWGDNGFDFTALNADGQTLLQRAIEWASGTGENSPNYVKFNGFTEAKATPDTTQVTISTPSSTAEGDLLIAAVACDGLMASSLSAPAGWNLLNVAEPSSSVTLGVWWKIASSSEPANHTFTWSSNERAYAWIMRFTGHDPASPIHTFATNVGTSQNPTSPALTTTSPNVMIVRVGGFDHNKITVDSPGLANHSTITMDASDFGTGKFQASGGAGYFHLTDPGDSGTADFAMTKSEEFVTITLGIAPEPED